MTQTLNNFRQLFLLVNWLKKQNEKNGSVNSIASTARELCRQAEAEGKHAANAEAVIAQQADEKLKSNFREIALWHHTRAIGKFCQAADLFSRIKSYGVSARVREHFSRKAAEMLSRAAQCESARLRL